MSVVTLTILSQGQAISSTIQVMAIETVKTINRIPYARIVLLDGDVSEQNFPISESKTFEPGNLVEIKLRYEGQSSVDKTVFKGVVIAQNISAGSQGSLLTVELKDKAVKLTVTRKSALFTKQTDDNVIGTIITNSGLQKGMVTTTKYQHPQLVQYNSTDWDFMLMRAEANGLMLVADDGEISAKGIDLNGAPKYTFEYGMTDIYGFEIEANVGQQYPEVASMGWDIKQQRPTKAAKAQELTLVQGNLKAKTIADSLGVKPGELQGWVALDPDELKAWSDGVLAQNRMAFLRGRIAIDGLADINLLDMIEIKGVGKRFNGKTLVTGVRHHVEAGVWQTHIQFGLPAERFAQQPHIQDAPAAGLLPGVHGLQVGMIDKFTDDPDKFFRVQVKLPGVGDQPIWARLAAPYAGKERGFYFMPEVGDEVIVGFFNDDPRQAVILGSMFGPKTGQPKGFGQPEKDNIDKGIVTKTGVTIHFKDDKKAALVIQTPAKNMITVDDDKQQIEIADEHGNKITMSKDGIVIKSAKDFKIDASGNVEIKGTKVDVK